MQAALFNWLLIMRISLRLKLAFRTFREPPNTVPSTCPLDEAEIPGQHQLVGTVRHKCEALKQRRSP